MDETVQDQCQSMGNTLEKIYQGSGNGIMCICVGFSLLTRSEILEYREI